MIKQTIALNGRGKVEIKEKPGNKIDVMLLCRKGIKWRVIDRIRLDVADETKVLDEAEAALRECGLLRQRMLDDPVSFIDRMDEVDAMNKRLEHLSKEMEQATIRLRKQVESAVEELIRRNIDKVVV